MCGNVSMVNRKNQGYRKAKEDLVSLVPKFGAVYRRDRTMVMV